MLAWLRRKLRDWLLEAGPEPPAKFSPILECAMNGRIVSYRIIRRAGSGLKGMPLGARGEELRVLFAEDALDPEEFQAKWMHFVGEAEVEWE